MKRSFLPRSMKACAALAICGALSGCVAALAVPAMTAAGALSERKRAEPAAAPAAPDVAIAEQRDAGDAATQAIVLTDLTTLPPPSLDPDDQAQEPWRKFAEHALGRAAALAAGEEVESALLAPGSAASLQARKRVCTDREAAVIVDIDPGKAEFAAPATLSPAPGAIAALGTLREAGVVVLWISKAKADKVAPIAAALKDSGLDPTGRDPILLLLSDDDRKQVLREQANEAVCALAIAGDEHADFDELFDYLRDPALGTMYDVLLGAGWFIVPPVLAETQAGS